MKITIFGANGKVGSLVVAAALKKGYDVSAFVHSASRLQSHSKLSIIQGDIYDRNVVGEAIVGSDVIISALGSWGTQNKDILTAGMNSILPAMKRQGINRIISLTGSDAQFTTDEINIYNKIMHYILSKTSKKVLVDGENHIKLLFKSGLQWTVIRSPIMNNFGDINKYSLGSDRPKPWQTINRYSVAQEMINQIDDNKYIDQAPYIKRD